MENLIELNKPEINSMLDILLLDNTTRKNIIWATDDYVCEGDQYKKDREITKTAILGLNPINIQPRVTKSLQAQQSRTKARAEVFTPSWICNQMNNYCDEDWFGKKDVFNTELEKSWETNLEKIPFANDKEWQKYITSTRLEITCGEAPFLVSRYDTTSGKYIDIQNRIGILDRKLRIINENINNKEDWFKWVEKAYKSTYGYEFQGDNLLIARINLLMTFIENYQYKWNEIPTVSNIRTIARIISWNLWQMDGLTDKTPFCVQEQYCQLSLFDKEKKQEPTFCKIRDWNKRKYILFNELKGKN